jgi:hypothetical protein
MNLVRRKTQMVLLLGSEVLGMSQLELHLLVSEILCTPQLAGGSPKTSLFLRCAHSLRSDGQAQTCQATVQNCSRPLVLKRSLINLLTDPLRLPLKTQLLRVTQHPCTASSFEVYFQFHLAVDASGVCHR